MSNQQRNIINGQHTCLQCRAIDIRVSQARPLCPICYHRNIRENSEEVAASER